MDESTRKKLEMGRRALAFCREHPDSNPQWIAAVARLEALLARAEELEKQAESELKLHRTSKVADPNGKIIPFQKPSPGDTTDPAA
ncbi:MAG TPA: hypothetical protein VE282_06505 [Gemmatimonadales bacterium]|nr:hypothetical protein [Gemmatimonadales bacterium]